MSKVIQMERAILNPHADPSLWVAGYAGMVQTPEDVFVLQCRRSDGGGLISPRIEPTPILCALWVYTPNGMESIVTWWGPVDRIAAEVSSLMQQEVTLTWQS